MNNSDVEGTKNTATARKRTTGGIGFSYSLDRHNKSQSRLSLFKSSLIHGWRSTSLCLKSESDKHRRGRPKGSLNKKTVTHQATEKSYEDGLAQPVATKKECDITLDLNGSEGKRKVGRPKGSVGIKKKFWNISPTDTQGSSEVGNNPMQLRVKNDKTDESGVILPVAITKECNTTAYSKGSEGKRKVGRPKGSVGMKKKLLDNSLMKTHSSSSFESHSITSSGTNSSGDSKEFFHVKRKVGRPKGSGTKSKSVSIMSNSESKGNEGFQNSLVKLKPCEKYISQEPAGSQSETSNDNSKSVLTKRLLIHSVKGNLSSYRNLEMKYPNGEPLKQKRGRPKGPVKIKPLNRKRGRPKGSVNIKPLKRKRGRPKGSVKIQQNVENVSNYHHPQNLMLLKVEVDSQRDNKVRGQNLLKNSEVVEKTGISNRNISNSIPEQPCIKLELQDGCHKIEIPK
ncbi:uncharacterized protein LOC124356158 [Homalodisca vitripennis]|uniref:uncharacterized protein LOC124356158 n=1 Tax=Homalodisca vitripennis TaxID=197043 RepID=UPI001EEC47FA|nr:uncharacterized protein LOC124356158 [Homalodisca vitripennis]